jgi:hypothetical protein
LTFLDKKNVNRKSLPIGPTIGKEKLTKPEAVRKGAELIAKTGVNSAEHLERAVTPSPIVTFGQRVEWCRKYHQAWVDGKPHPVRTMESALTKHILPRFGSLPLDAITETSVQEFAAELKQAIFERQVRAVYCSRCWRARGCGSVKPLGCVSMISILSTV